jgi:signal transduction histidine kinase/ActR/RegA family two-component response regulator
MKELLKTGAIREYSREKRYLREDGSEVWVLLTVSAMWAPGEKPDFCIAVAQDITGQKQLETQVQHAQRMESIGTLAGGIAHDFNNILAVIHGYAQLAEMNLKENPAVRDHLGAVLQASDRAADLVRQILSLSRRQPVERRPIHLRPIVAEGLKLLRATIPRTIDFDLSLAADAPAVLADPTQVNQILMNLGMNASHAMKEHTGRLQVRLEKCLIDEATARLSPELRPGTYARLCVGDTGCGMDAMTQRKIFEPLFTTKPPGEGTGLGLAVVQGIMQGYEGAITVSSELGKGTTFQLYFPSCGGEVPSGVLAEQEAPRGNGARLLVVDDEELLARWAQVALSGLGYAVEIATLPAEALAAVHADPRRFALVFTDQTMPGMTGLVLAARLREVCPDLPVILMTGSNFSLTPEQAAADGICQLLLKPTTVLTLATAAATALAARRRP